MKIGFGMAGVKDGDKVQYIKEGIWKPYFITVEEETDAITKMQNKKKRDAVDDPFKEFEQ